MTGAMGQGQGMVRQRRRRPPAPHCHEQLFVGWKQLAQRRQRGHNNEKEGEPRDRDGDREYNDNHTTKMAVMANNEGDDEHGTRTEGAGDGYGAIGRGMQKRAQETSSTSLGP